MSVHEICDVFEIQTWAAGERSTISKLKENLEALLVDVNNLEAETLAQEVFDEIGKRVQRLGPAYPFDSDGNSLWANTLANEGSSYLFCVSLSVLRTGITNPIRTVEFETLVMQAAQAYFGGSAIRIGAPWQTPQVPDYETLLHSVVDLIPELGPPTRTAAPAGGDGGWDVLIVKNFHDREFPRLIALGNCATGRTDWLRKGSESKPTYFWSFFTREHRSVCITFFAAPFLMEEDDRLRKIDATTLTFDRLRICQNAPHVAPTAARWLNENRDNLLNIPLT